MVMFTDTRFGALIHRPTTDTETGPHRRRTYFTAYSCERSSLRLSCPPTMTIIPVHATYGRRNLRQCAEGQVDMDKWTESCFASPRHTRRRISQQYVSKIYVGQSFESIFVARTVVQKSNKKVRINSETKVSVNVRYSEAWKTNAHKQYFCKNNFDSYLKMLYCC